jgi:hypothetical protein
MEKSLNTKKQGFAVVMAIVLMSFLVLLILSMVSYNRIETLASVNNIKLMQARENAKMGVMVAIGQLQRYAGKDTISTARADITAQNTIKNSAMQQYLTGVWSHTPGKNNPIHQTWLISGKPSPIKNNFTSENALLFEGIEPKNDIYAPKVDIEISDPQDSSLTTATGRYAYITFDEGIKAKINLPFPDRREKDPAAIPYRMGAGAIENFQPFKSNVTNEELHKIFTKQQLALTNFTKNPNKSEVLKKAFHHITTSSMGVLSDSKNGGLKKDLTAGLQKRESMIEQESGSDRIFPPAVGALKEIDPGGPFWEQLRSYYNLKASDGRITVRPQTEKQQGIYPVVTLFQVFYLPSLEFFARDQKIYHGHSKYQIRMHIVPAFVLWNPYNVKLERDDYAVVFYTNVLPKKLSTSANDRFNLKMRGSDDNAFGKEINFKDIFRIKYTEPTKWEVYTYQDGTEKINPASHIPPAFQKPLMFQIKNADFAPGEAKLFVPRSRHTLYDDEDPEDNLLEEENEINAQDFTKRTFYQKKFNQFDASVLYLDNDKEKNYLYFPGPGCDVKPQTPPEFAMRQIYQEDQKTKEEHLAGFMLFQGRLKNIYNENKGTFSFRNNLVYIKGLSMKRRDPNNDLSYWIHNPDDDPYDLLDQTEEYNSALINNIYNWQNPLQFKGENENLDHFSDTSSIPMYGRKVMMRMTENTGDKESGSNGKYFDNNSTDQKSRKIKWLANYNPRSSTFGRSPIGTDSSEGFLTVPNYQSGIIPSPDDDVAEIKGTFVGFSEKSGSKKTILFEIPREQTPEEHFHSIGQFMHAQLTISHGDRLTYLNNGFGTEELFSDNLSPAYAIGNSLADPHIPNTETFQPLSALGFKGYLYDISYMLNKALWDKYFLSTVPRRGKLKNDDRTYRPFWNPRLIPYEQPSEENLRDFDKAAASLMINGAFNVNSTSQQAWEALLASFIGADVTRDTARGETKTETTEINESPMLRITRPHERALRPTDRIDKKDVPYLGYRQLTMEEIKELAKEIVTQIKERGPFTSLADFINRTPTSNNPVHQLKGLLQTAIDNTQINKIFYQEKDYIIDPKDYSKTYNREAAAGPTAANSPCYLTQADILARVGSVLTTRSDTFVIRSYGETINPVTQEIEGNAWCEATVQRIPEFVDPIDFPETPVEQLTSETNKTFGRKFKIIEFRWLTKEQL